MSDWAVSALKWWQEAGVDTLVAETPRDWLSPAPQRLAEPGLPTSAPSASAPSPQRAKESLPETLEAFQQWLMTGDVPLAASSAPRLGAAGDPRSGLMVMVDMPSDEDFAAGRLLSGEAGALFDRMMTAIGRSRETLYLAPVSPVRTPTGMVPAEAAAELAAIARHHIALAAPKALLLFGETCAKLLLGAPIAETRAKWHELSTPTGKIRTLVTIRPEKLERQPGLKKLAWEDLQMLREELKP